MWNREDFEAVRSSDHWVHDLSIASVVKWKVTAVRQEPLRVELERLSELSFENFPQVDDFMVDLREANSATTLRYVCPSLGIVITFPWWNHAVNEIRGWTAAEIPCGSINSPFWDRDQGWNILIWQVHDRVYITEGDGDPEIYERWFTISRDLYWSEWKKAIAGLS